MTEAETDDGAILFIVFRANYFEGFNLPDKLCRGVIVIGQPFPNPNGFILSMKKKLFGI